MTRSSDPACEGSLARRVFVPGTAPNSALSSHPKAVENGWGIGINSLPPDLRAADLNHAARFKKVQNAMPSADRGACGEQAVIDAA